MAGCLVEFLGIQLFLSILIGSKIVAISAGTGVESISLDDYFNANCIGTVNIDILEPSEEELWTLLGVSFCACILDVLAFCILMCISAAKESGVSCECCGGSDKCEARVIYTVGFLQSIEILVYFAILIHLKVYVDGLEGEFIKKSLVDCSEYEDFQDARYWSNSGVWFCAITIVVALICIMYRQFAILVHNNKKKKDDANDDMTYPLEEEHEKRMDDVQNENVQTLHVKDTEQKEENKENVDNAENEAHDTAESGKIIFVSYGFAKEMENNNMRII
eukprot:252943_1